jgi:hypothetical protein
VGPVLDSALTPTDELGQRALATKTLDHTLGGVGIFSLHLGSITNFSLDQSGISLGPARWAYGARAAARSCPRIERRTRQPVLDLPVAGPHAEPARRARRLRRLRRGRKSQAWATFPTRSSAKLPPTRTYPNRLGMIRNRRLARAVEQLGRSVVRTP